MFAVPAQAARDTPAPPPVSSADASAITSGHARGDSRAAVEPERRYDADGDAWFTKDEFIEYYGGTAEWDTARRATTKSRRPPGASPAAPAVAAPAPALTRTPAGSSSRGGGSHAKNHTARGDVAAAGGGEASAGAPLPPSAAPVLRSSRIGPSKKEALIRV